jgi:flagellar biosynthesis chaperone FliJ
MSARARLQPLLALRDRRVSQAMQHVEACNREVREKEVERDAARARWTEADNAWRNQQRTYADQVANNLHQDVAARSLELAAARCDWWRARVDACLVALQVAQATLTNAEGVAAHARREYMRAHARQQALTTLMMQQKRQWQATDLRAEEVAAEDLQINRGSVERS